MKLPSARATRWPRNQGLKAKRLRSIRALMTLNLAIRVGYVSVKLSHNSPAQSLT